jgi:hypothetical protein
MENHEQKKKVKSQDFMGKTNFFLRTLTLSSLENTGINELNTRFQQKFATGSYGVGIGRAWCSRKASEICSSLV